MKIYLYKSYNILHVHIWLQLFLVLLRCFSMDLNELASFLLPSTISFSLDTHTRHSSCLISVLTYLFLFYKEHISFFSSSNQYRFPSSAYPHLTLAINPCLSPLSSLDALPFPLFIYIYVYLLLYLAFMTLFYSTWYRNSLSLSFRILDIQSGW